MGNAQEAIEEYENRADSARRLDAADHDPKFPKSPISMILDHEYSDDGKVKYLCQAVDGRQKWKSGPKEYNLYWTNSRTTIGTVRSTRSSTTLMTSGMAKPDVVGSRDACLKRGGNVTIFLYRNFSAPI